MSEKKPKPFLYAVGDGVKHEVLQLGVVMADDAEDARVLVARMHPSGVVHIRPF